MNQVITETTAGSSVVVRYPKDLDITVYGDGRWRYAASLPDDQGSYREVYLHPLDGGGWGLRLHEHVAVPEYQGETEPRWKDGLPVEALDAHLMTYEVAQGAAELWLRGERIGDVA